MTSSGLVVLTGGSSGLGLAMATALALQGQKVLSLARRTNDALPADVEQWKVDLIDPVPVAQRLTQWLSSQKPSGPVTFISNAGMNVSPSALSAADPAELSTAIRVDLEAGVVLTCAFLAATRAWRVPRKVLLISSGVARMPLADNAAYGAAKAGLDQLARTVVLGEAAVDGGARIVSLAPGRFESPMMALLRNADASVFANRDEFVNLAQNGGLDSPEEAAAKVLAYIARPDFGEQPVADVRQA